MSSSDKRGCLYWLITYLIGIIVVFITVSIILSIYLSYVNGIKPL